MQLPYKGEVRVSSPFGWRTLNGKRVYHKGIDLVGTDKTVRAVVGGVVGQSTIITDHTNRTSEWGNYVRIDGEDGRLYYYCHLSQRLVSRGDKVSVGDALGVEGSTGKSTGSHLHFEVRENGKSIDPTAILGIKNIVGAVREAKTQERTNYTVNGLTICRADDFGIEYHDAGKKNISEDRYINGGFFGAYKGELGTFTLPVANLVCDIGRIEPDAEKYIKPYVRGGKLRYGCGDNASTQFHGKKVSTLVKTSSGRVYVADLAEPPSDAIYAISGVPTVRGGDDVDYYNYVKSQGWDESCMYATYRNWLAVRDGKIWVISGKTATRNYIYGMEFWKRIRGERFDDIICLDGGGSYVRKTGTGKYATTGNRRVNNYLTY
nr:MAG TPA: membrane protein [Caudoviricetes sp.]